MTFDNDDYIIMTISLTTSIFSLVGVIAMIASYYLVPGFKNENRKYLSLLSLIDGLLNLIYILLLWNTDVDWVCAAFTLFTTYLTPCSMFWTMFLSYTFWKKMASVGVWKPGRRSLIFWHCLSWGYPALGILLLLSSSSFYDQEAIGCWIPRHPWYNVFLRFITVYSVIWFAWLFNTWMYLRIFKEGQKLIGQILIEEDRNTVIQQQVYEMDDQLRLLKWIPLIFVLLRLPGSINAIKDLFSDKTILLIDVLEAFGDQAQAGIHGILYVFTHKKFQKHCCQSMNQYLMSASRTEEIRYVHHNTQSVRTPGYNSEEGYYSPRLPLEANFAEHKTDSPKLKIHSKPKIRSKKFTVSPRAPSLNVTSLDLYAGVPGGGGPPVATGMGDSGRSHKAKPSGSDRKVDLPDSEESRIKEGSRGSQAPLDKLVSRSHGSYAESEGSAGEESQHHADEDEDEDIDYDQGAQLITNIVSVSVSSNLPVHDDDIRI